MSSYSSSISLQHMRSSHTGLSIPEDEANGEGNNGHIDNPMVEKRRFELFIDLIWVGIIGNLVSRQAYLGYCFQLRLSKFYKEFWAGHGSTSLSG